MPILEVRDVESGYADVQILWGASLFLEEGRITSLVGGNGVGKTTLLRTVMGLVKPQAGKVFFNGQDVSKVSAHKKAEMGLILVPEGRQLFVQMSVEENLEMGAAPARAKARYDYNLERVYEIFPRLKERRDQKASTLSGGEQQMLAMGRAMMSRPKLLLMDEPSMGLAPILVEQSFEIIKQINQQGTSVFMVEQNASMALSIADRGYVLQTGRVVLTDQADKLLNNEQMRQAYLGR